MRILLFIIALLPSYLFAQQSFEVFGSISGEYNSKMYLFFEGNYKQKDSISSEILDGKFYFKGKVVMPVLARLALDDQNSFIADFYIDNSKTHVSCTTRRKIYKAADNNADTMNMLNIISVHGSKLEDSKTVFTHRLNGLYHSAKTEGEKQEAYYEELTAFVKQHQKSRVSPYLVSNATNLYYHQVQELSNLYDTSLRSSFEATNVKRLLSRLDKSGRSVPGITFHDFILKDTSGRQVNTSQQRGKYTLMVFWASWCGPCRAEHPELNDKYMRYKDRGLQLIGVSLNESYDKWVKAIAKDKLHWPQVSDLKHRSEIGDYYGLIETGEGIPFNILLDEEGKIVDKKITIKDLDKMLQTLL
jgi:peroxiredoxin